MTNVKRFPNFDEIRERGIRKIKENSDEKPTTLNEYILWLLDMVEPEGLTSQDICDLLPTKDEVRESRFAEYLPRDRQEKLNNIDTFWSQKSVSTTLTVMRFDKGSVRPRNERFIIDKKGKPKHVCEMRMGAYDRNPIAVYERTPADQWREGNELKIYADKCGRKTKKEDVPILVIAQRARITELEQFIEVVNPLLPEMFKKEVIV